MQRYPAFDPPEYVDWSPDPDVMRRFRATIEGDSERRDCIERLSAEVLVALYAGMVRFRLHDIFLKRWVRQGVISKAWLGTGEEATTVGPVHALDRSGAEGDVVAPMIRNAGACHELGMPLADMFRGYLATADSPNRGRDLHIGGREYGVITPISLVGSVAPVVAGLGLAFRLQRSKRLALTWVGDGATKTGEVHEAFNFATVQRLPVIYIIQNNQVALGTLLGDHHAGADFADWGRIYGAASAAFDGNNVLDAFAATRWAVDKCRSGAGPVLLTAETFRMGGHATHDEREARELFPAETFAFWGRRDPIGCYETWLVEGARDLSTGELVAPGSALESNRAVVAEVEAAVIAEVEAAAEEALASRSDMPDGESTLEGVYGEWPETSYPGPARFY
ncbi:MAG: thiamine pyrophosphate-dependent dehydrogenase E1 component subunit alpha [Gemmatimonadales bacterium]